MSEVLERGKFGRWVQTKEGIAYLPNSEAKETPKKKKKGKLYKGTNNPIWKGLYS